MYIADMFCFGKDKNAVGVNGIRGCMGVFVDHACQPPSSCYG
jgi:hypothetical protein